MWLLVMACLAGAARAEPQWSDETASLPSFPTVSIVPTSSGQVDFQFLPNQIRATTVTLKELIEEAYGLQPWEIAGGPEWAHVERFHVTATTQQRVSRDRMKLMLQSMLADRFQLQLTRETRTLPVYKLVRLKASKLKLAKPNERFVMRTAQEDTCGGFVTYVYSWRNAGISDLLPTLSREVQAPVIDETDLTGRFNFQLRFTYDDVFGNEPDIVPTIFIALEKQLGFKLVADKAQIPVFAIQGAVKPPASTRGLNK